MMYKILVVEDDMTIAGALERHLSKWDYEVRSVEDFKNVMNEFVEYDPQLVLLDIALPFFNGFHWCNEIRKVSKVPIIFISSANDNMNIVMAMNMGGDEFIEKPFDLNVVTAKVQALLRRTYSFQGALNVIEHKGVLLNLNDAAVTYREKKLEHAGQIVSRDDIIERLWESDEFIDDNTLTVNVARLRKRLETIGLGDMITTKKGIGYMVEV